MQTRTMFNSPIARPLLRGLSQFLLKSFGWKVTGGIPKELQKCVIIAAPHTTNWDMPVSLMVAFSLDTSLHWVGKSSIFRFPFGGLMRWMGGIPVDRSQSNNMVAATVETFAQYSELRIMMAPEGTRAKVRAWKSGFYHIAHGAGVPLALGFVDYKNRCAGIGKIINTSGNYDADMVEIREFYRPFEEL